MKKILVIVVIIAAIFFMFFGQDLFLTYEKMPFHDSYYTGSENKKLYTATFEEMITLLDRETLQEKGKAIMKYNFINLDKTKAKITIQETYTGDDSVGPSKKYIIVEKQAQGWTVIEYARTTNCSRGRSATGGCL